MFKRLVVLVMAVMMMFSVMNDTAYAKATSYDNVSEGFGGATAEELAESEAPYTKKELRLMAAIIFCEAGGQCYAGRIAVGCVIMNRKRSSAYPNSLWGVISQRGQFGPYSSGKLKRELKKYDKGLYNKPERRGSLKAAKAVLEGQDYVMKRGKKINMRKYHDFNGHISNAKLRISGHDFR